MAGRSRLPAARIQSPDVGFQEQRRFGSYQREGVAGQFNEPSGGGVAHIVGAAPGTPVVDAVQSRGTRTAYPLLPPP